MEKKATAPRRRSEGRGQERSLTRDNILHLSESPRTRPGILSYRRERSAAEFCRAIRDALDRESRQARAAGVGYDGLEGIASAWVGRGCLP